MNLSNYQCDGQMGLFDFINKQDICKIDHSFHCNHAEAKKVATMCGENCKYDCCLSCSNMCGARCNPSAHLAVRKYKQGQWIEKEELGRELTFDEIASRVGKLIVMDYSTQSRLWYKVVLVEKIIQHEGTRRLIYKDETRQRGYVNEMYFANNYQGHRSKAYDLAKC